MFKPNEITDEKSSLYERSVPIDVKIPNIEIKITPSEKAEIKVNIDNLLKSMKSNFDIAFSSNVIKNGETNWFKNISATITHLKNDYNIKHELLQKYVIHHMIDEILFNEKLKFIEYIYTTDKSDIII